MPDVHVGKGATVGSVIATHGAIIPAAVGVDIGCGMMAVQTTLTASDLPDSLAALRSRIERAVPHGSRRRAAATTRLVGDGAGSVLRAWAHLERRFEPSRRSTRSLSRRSRSEQLGTLGGGNHFIEVCLDDRADRLGDVALGFAWHRQPDRPAFIELARRTEEALHQPAGSRPGVSSWRERDHFDDYVEAMAGRRTTRRRTAS